MITLTLSHDTTIAFAPLPIFFLLLIFFWLTATLIYRIGQRTERRYAAEKLFKKAHELFGLKHYSEALEMLRFMRLDFVDKNWFEKFLKSHKTITREVFCELNAQALFEIRNDHTKLLSGENLQQEHLSDEELALRIGRIWELTEPPEGYEREKMVSEVVDAFLNKTTQKSIIKK